jgi:hypothetical protein
VSKKRAPPPPSGRSPSPGNPGEDLRRRRLTRSSPAFAGEGDHAKHGGGASSDPESPTARARRLRRTLSPAEALLWQHLRTRPTGFKFRRQHKAAPFTPDFYCHEAAEFAAAWDAALAFAQEVRAVETAPAAGLAGIETLRVPRYYRGRLIGFVHREDVRGAMRLLGRLDRLTERLREPGLHAHDERMEAFARLTGIDTSDAKNV